MEINDKRTIKEFKGQTFSKFKKNDVIKRLIKCILDNKIEEACNWTAELICSGNYITLWETIFLILSKYINVGNPKLPIYIEMRFDLFKDTLQNGYIDNELALRNNKTIRTLFAELITTLCISTKRPGIEAIKIKKDEEFKLENISQKFKAPDISFAKDIFKSDDPKELFVAINEFSFLLQQKKSLLDTCYWIEWVLEYTQVCKKSNKKLLCSPRDFAPEKFNKDPIWIIWELLFHYSPSKFITKIITALLALYTVKFNLSIKRRRKFIIYFAIQLIFENINTNIAIIEDDKYILLQDIIKNQDKVYSQLKKNEISPNTDYLFNGLTNAKSNLDKTIEKLNIMKSIT